MMCCLPPEAGDFGDAGTYLAERLTTFMRTLRNNAFAVGLKESEDAARVLASPLVARPTGLRSALKALVCARRSDWLKFDEVFDAFWLGRGMRRVVPLTSRAQSSKRTERRQLSGPEVEQKTEAGLGEQVPASGEEQNDSGSSPARMEGASRRERLAETDFRKIHDPKAIAEAHALAARLARRMRTRLSRRERVRAKGRRIDMRRTIRRNVSHGGVPIELVWRKRKRKPLRLVVLLDASGSMSLYTAVFVRFIHGVLDNFREAEAFLFHTRLVHVSNAMREKDAARALERLSLLAQGVGGGTRIGESLATFNRWHAKSVIHSRTCVMIISDGYDTGPPEAMAVEMQRLAKRCKRIVWLNPMIGWDDYEPSARGMQAALPHIDLFATAHNLKSLAALEPYLVRL
ncbi:MAG: VWA domain-containing protein [Hyphomonadaceae bacterium]|nr:VWA domain-containing protein [Hyphomonadaceae bacterium]